jgi:carboxyl-terminal processing protease
MWRWVLAGLAVAGAARAEPMIPAGQGCADLRPAMRAAADVLAARYVIPQAGAAGARALVLASRQPEAANVCGGPQAQAARLTAIARAAIPDWHLRIYPGAPGPKPGTTPPVPAAVDPDPHGIAEIAHLAGGIGYLRISEFDDVNLAAPVLGHAMALIGGSKGVILDVRGNPGGDGDTMDLVSRSFLPPGAPITLQTYDRTGARVEAAPHDPSWPRFDPAVKVVVLVDRGSASAAEALAFVLREEGRAVIVGRRSLGAAHIVHDAAVLPGGFSLSIPEFRFQGRKSGQDWEGQGVAPDIEATGQDALLLAWEQARKGAD